MILKLIFQYLINFWILLFEKVIETIAVHEIGVATYYLDVLRLLLE